MRTLLLALAGLSGVQALTVAHAGLKDSSGLLAGGLGAADVTQRYEMNVEAHLVWASQELVNALVPLPSVVSNASAIVANRTLALKKEKDNMKTLFAHLKSNIAQINKQEADNKQHTQALIDKSKKRLEHDKELLKNTKSKWEHELLINRTRNDEEQVEYWSKGRTLQHGMFHANLKLNHGMMSRVQTVMEAYEQALTKGRLDPSVRTALARVSDSMPKPAANVVQVETNASKALVAANVVAAKANVVAAKPKEVAKNVSATKRSHTQTTTKAPPAAKRAPRVIRLAPPTAKKAIDPNHAVRIGHAGNKYQSNSKWR